MICIAANSSDLTLQEDSDSKNDRPDSPFTRAMVKATHNLNEFMRERGGGNPKASQDIKQYCLKTLSTTTFQFTVPEVFTPIHTQSITLCPKTVAVEIKSTTLSMRKPVPYLTIATTLIAALTTSGFLVKWRSLKRTRADYARRQKFYKNMALLGGAATIISGLALWSGLSWKECKKMKKTIAKTN